jgi:Vasohibin
MLSDTPVKFCLITRLITHRCTSLVIANLCFAACSLAYKELRYASLAALIADYRSAYSANWHTLERVYIGLPLPHDAACNALLKWKVRRLRTEQLYSHSSRSTTFEYKKCLSTPDTYICVYELQLMALTHALTTAIVDILAHDL